MSSPTSPSSSAGQVRLRLQPGRQVEHLGETFTIRSAGPTTCELQAGEIRVDVATHELLCEQLELEMTSIDPTRIAARSGTGCAGWYRASLRTRQHAVELSYVLFELLTGYSTGGPITGAPTEVWAPFAELSSMTERAAVMSAQIAADPSSEDRLGFAAKSGRQLRRLAAQFEAADYDPASLLDKRTTAHRDPNFGLSDEQQSIVEAVLMKGVQSKAPKRALMARVRVAFHQRHVALPDDYPLRSYVGAAIDRHELQKSAAHRRSTEARPHDTMQQVQTSYAGQYVEIDEWRIDMVGSVLGILLRDLRLLVAMDVHTRAVLAIEVTVGQASIEQVLSFLFRVLTPVSHALGKYPVPSDVHLPVPDHLVADLSDLIDSKPRQLPHVAVDTVVTDQGAQFTSRHVTAVLERVMVSVIGLPPARPTGKPHIEKFFDRLKGFVAELPGYTGGSPGDRGSTDVVEIEGVLAPHELQDLFVRFALAYNRAEHQGLPTAPGTTRHLSPIEALTQSSHQRGFPETLTSQVVPYWFLPIVSKAVAAQPFRHQLYTFDSPLLDDLRGTKQWFHYSKIDPTRVFLFHPGRKQWITIRGNATKDALKRATHLGETAVSQALETTEWHTINDHHDLIDALASAYAVRPELSDEENRRRIGQVWKRRDQVRLLELGPPAIEAAQAAPVSAGWERFEHTDDVWEAS